MPQTANITAAQLWNKSHELHAAFIGWLKSKGIDNPYDLGKKPAKQKAAKFLTMMHVRKVA